MEDYQNRGISEEELMNRFLNLARAVESKKEEVDIYFDCFDEIDEIARLKGNSSTQAVENALGNHREYLIKRIELRDSYMQLKAVYELGKTFFPDTFGNERIREHMESEDFRGAVSLDGIINAIIAEEKKELEMER